MIDTIYVAMSGLRGYEQGLRTISNNTANLNTPGFKSSGMQFADMFHSNGGAAGGDFGFGLKTLGTTLNFRQGQVQNTGNPLDLALEGEGLFTVRGTDGSLRYTRDGQFKFNTEGVLVAGATGKAVMAQDANGGLSAITLGVLKSSAARATTFVLFGGNVSTTATPQSAGITVYDAGGTAHALTARLEAVTEAPGTWNVSLLEGATSVGTGTLRFVDGRPDPAASKLAMTFTPAGQPAVPLTLDFSANVTSSGTEPHGTLSMASQDGWGPGGLTQITFDSSGVLQLAYSNGQTLQGSRLALRRFGSPDAVRAVGNNEFEVLDGKSWESGVAGEHGFGTIQSGAVEMSNVDLSQQFSDLVIMQRGYQACSQVVSTANEMLTELFSIRGK